MSLSVRIRKRLSNRFCLEADFTTETGSCLGILGSSGAGKTIMLKSIAGIETPDEGRIVVNGRVLFDSTARINLKPQARRCGYLFQNYALFPTMTALGNICAGMNARRLSRHERRKKARDYLEQVELGGLEHHKPAALSGGQQQRLALARMLAAGPDCILLDEPFSALDSNLREQMHLLFIEILKNYPDIVLVTHSRDEAYKLCREILILDAGAVLRHGERDNVFQNPHNVTAARLTGCKNISPAVQTGDAEVFAADWDLRLRLAKPVPAGITHVGIRAHDISLPPESGADGGLGHNEMRPAFIRVIPAPFETMVLFTNAAAPENGTNKEIVWALPRRLGTAAFSPPQRLFFPPDSLLPLCGG
ncbi:MAG: ATP-binding cassette domain-containing protein [Spirochaetaceae bacterium]|jgi:molybdate transport system ATP-binding protein|nr:ATP-binding cassette domain-containing protein [Spirochaetaceae bacterium]